MIKPIVQTIDPRKGHSTGNGWFLDTPIEIPLSKASVANNLCDVLTDVLICWALDVPAHFILVLANVPLPADVPLPIDPVCSLGVWDLAWMIQDNDIHVPLWNSQDTPCVYAYLYVESIADDLDFETTPITVKLGVQQA